MRRMLRIDGCGGWTPPKRDLAAPDFIAATPLRVRVRAESVARAVHYVGNEGETWPARGGPSHQVFREGRDPACAVFELS